MKPVLRVRVTRGLASIIIEMTMAESQNASPNTQEAASERATGTTASYVHRIVYILMRMKMMTLSVYCIAGERERERIWPDVADVDANSLNFHHTAFRYGFQVTTG